MNSVGECTEPLPCLTGPTLALPAASVVRQRTGLTRAPICGHSGFTELDACPCLPGCLGPSDATHGLSGAGGWPGAALPPCRPPPYYWRDATNPPGSSTSVLVRRSLEPASQGSTQCGAHSCWRSAPRHSHLRAAPRRRPRDSTPSCIAGKLLQEETHNCVSPPGHVPRKGRGSRGRHLIPECLECSFLASHCHCQGNRARMRGTRLMGVLLALAGLLQVALCLRIAAFNIQTFGETKMSNATLSNYIVQILRRYDIALVQEVRDSHLTAVGKLLDKLNQQATKQDTLDTYQFVVSKPLGRNSYKERYLFLYRPDQVTVLDSYYFDDGCEPCGNDTFSREPAIVRFSSPFTSVRDFAIVPLHSAPLDAVAEIDALYDVYLDVLEKWDVEGIMFMGDFNAGCSYVTPSQWASIRLRTDPAFYWLIPDSADTTVSATHCAYDRIVVSGTLLQRSVVPDSAAPFDFQAAYGLSNQLARAISDHYPVEVLLRRV